MMASSGEPLACEIRREKESGGRRSLGGFECNLATQMVEVEEGDGHYTNFVLPARSRRTNTTVWDGRGRNGR